MARGRRIFACDIVIAAACAAGAADRSGWFVQSLAVRMPGRWNDGIITEPSADCRARNQFSRSQAS